ncbi:ribonuclease P protein component [Candidatus Daviesbacteria bacterium]|nr:ribonuclease P protein component [Candidatus Daviesbacteria bacterium]
MLSKDKRLNLKTDFKWVATGDKVETKFAKLFVKNGQNAQARLGIALSGKSFNKANERNRARRLMSKGFEGLYDKLPKDINIIALPKHAILEVKSQEVLSDLEEGLKKAEII